MEWITASDVRAEVWRRLLEYANTDLALDAIVRIHGPAASRSLRSNFRKQASQIRVTILQAQEYFDAAQEASLITSPNPLYYGAYSLSSAVMLLRGGGEKSLDFLRRDSSNATHGLSFSVGLATAASTGIDVLSNSYVTVMRRGHFANWYSTLPGLERMCAVIHREAPGGGTLTSMAEQGFVDTRPISEIASHKSNLLDLCCSIPDLDSDLRRYRVASPSSRCTYEVNQNAGGMPTLHTWRLHGAQTPGNLLEILGCFRAPHQYIDEFRCSASDESTACIVTLPVGSSRFMFFYPSIRVCVDGEQIAYSADLDIPESADAYRISYGLSMLARYFPDIWLSAVESHGIASKIVERVVATLVFKIPILALSLLESRQIVISSHRPPWFD